METRRIQRSGTTYYLYLPASWCREHKITTDSTVFLDRSSTGNLEVKPKKDDTTLSSLKLELTDSNHDVINKMLIATYINPVKEFGINLTEKLTPDQILGHKSLLGGLELIDFEESSITCQTALALSDPDILLDAMIKKLLRITKLMQQDSKHELINKYEEEIDKTNLLIHKSIISSLMYRKESKLRHIDLFYIGLISRSIEQIADLLIAIENDKPIIKTVERMITSLSNALEKITMENAISFVKEIGKLEKVQVKNLETYKKKKIYSVFDKIAETLCDWYITELIDEKH